MPKTQNELIISNDSLLGGYEFNSSSYLLDSS